MIYAATAVNVSSTKLKLSVGRADALPFNKVGSLFSWRC